MSEDFAWGFDLTDDELRFVDNFLARRNAIGKWRKPRTMVDWIDRWDSFVADMGSYLFEEYLNECHGREILGRELIDLGPSRVASRIAASVGATDANYLSKTRPLSQPWARIRNEQYRWLYERCPEGWAWYREHGIN